MDDILSKAGASTPPSPKRQMTKEKIMKAIVVTDQAAGTAGMKLVKRAEPQVRLTREPSRVISTGLAGRLRQMSDNNRPLTRALPSSETSAVKVARADVS